MWVQQILLDDLPHFEDQSDPTEDVSDFDSYAGRQGWLNDTNRVDKDGEWTHLPSIAGPTFDPFANGASRGGVHAPAVWKHIWTLHTSEGWIMYVNDKEYARGPAK